jgi:hypothetical protein
LDDGPYGRALCRRMMGAAHWLDATNRHNRPGPTSPSWRRPGACRSPARGVSAFAIHRVLGRTVPQPVEVQNISSLVDTRPVTFASEKCDHDAKASGRLVLEEGGIRQEIVCECGRVLSLLGREAYHLDPWAARHRRATRERWRVSRALVLAVRRGRSPRTRPATDKRDELATATDRRRSVP